MKKIQMPTLRQLVTFAICMENGEGIIGKHPSYLFEKFNWCIGRNCPEAKFDLSNQAKFKIYTERLKLNWDTARDYWDIPMDQFDPKTGEPILEKEGKNGGNE